MNDMQLLAVTIFILVVLIIFMFYLMISTARATKNIGIKWSKHNEDE